MNITTSESKGRSKDNHETDAPAAIDGPDLRRRRWMRGAVAAAPVVLTLRSGALAASSCVPAKATAYAEPDRGKLENINPGNVSLAEGEYCVKGYTDSGCPSLHVRQVQPVSAGLLDNKEGKWYCKAGRDRIKNANIAIFSSPATYMSFLGTN